MKLVNLDLMNSVFNTLNNFMRLLKQLKNTTEELLKPFPFPPLTCKFEITLFNL